MLVDELVPHGPAAKGGLRAGDRIVSVDGTAVRGLADLRTALRRRAAGDTVSLVVQRAGARHTIRVTLGARPHTAVPAHGKHAPQARRPAPHHTAPHDRRETARPYLGLELEERDGSLWITRVLEDSPAAEAQLEPGWQLRKVDGRSVSRLDDVAKLLADK
ncbi:MAG: PDZ domain-containing protein, partial [Planctomycetota bacterium]